MGDDVKAVIGIFTAIIGVAIISVILSGNSQTSTVIGAVTKGFATDLQAATSPITGNGFTANTLANLTSSSAFGQIV